MLVVGDNLSHNSRLTHKAYTFDCDLCRKVLLLYFSEGCVFAVDRTSFIPFFFQLKKPIMRLPVFLASVTLRLRPQVVSDTCLGAFERPQQRQTLHITAGVYCLLLMSEDGFSAGDSERRVKHDRQPNDGKHSSSDCCLWQHLRI